MNIAVLDVNDNSPVFILTPDPSHSRYVSIVSVGLDGEQSPALSCLIQLKATDADSGLNGDVSTYDNWV